MPPISVLMKPASGLCNMQCDYCFYCDEMEKRKQQSYGFMSEETLKNVIRKTMFRAEGYISYAFQGGEPLLRGLPFFEKVIEYQEKYNRNHIQVSNALQTNGYALDEDWCRFFKKHNFLLGVSVDGTKEIHDGYRHTQGGKDTYDTIAEHIGLLEKHGVDYNILTVVTSKVATNIKTIYQEYSKRGWRYQQYIECLDPLGEEKGVRPYSLKPLEFGQFMMDLFDLWYEDWKQGRQPYIRKFENYIAILAGYWAESCEQRGICGIQTVVEADGSVYPCDFYMTDEYRLGNFNQNRLEEINQKRLEIGFVERSQKISTECKRCRYFKICRGGCHRSKEYDIIGEGYRSFYCQGYQMFFDHCLERMKEMAKTI
ncbi:radical SAM/SPASM domain-containing protein [Lachnospiraceae bacterium]|nr:radical SAM/SPASM domain-containing protein [Lachnospiraceae bacterium]GKH41849.1 radical SAM/SPASM domain-containing protein [Lachnospiraceae bacterium]GKH54446.1 radical SAM/SPASM domain-containing protein [Lachnospiraceae bacterium]